MSINFHFIKNISLQNRKALKLHLENMFSESRKVPGIISYIFCDDSYIRNINRTFLNHDYPTDILTFDLSNPKSTLVDAEIYISVDTIRDNAQRYNCTLGKELHRVIFHGILHLCGFKDKTISQQKRMTEMEDYYLATYFGT
ncbi:MAG: rRNA maturation RNase YbeY [Chitinophagaceae bacterium]|nr:MAG: rRNA maturation RNase YbeY [Chitinophagaceae bacterium]